MDGLEPTLPTPEPPSSSPIGPSANPDEPTSVSSPVMSDPTTDPERDIGDPGSSSGSDLMPNPKGPFPQEFGRYRLLEYLGGGGMGMVFLARDLKLEIHVAVKIPRRDFLAKPRLMERFRREARYAARLVHPGLAWVIDLGQVASTHYLVMRYVPGTPLSEVTNLNAWQSAAIVRDVAIAMAAAHGENVVHRDLKPSNIVITPDGTPVVIDFGLALRLDDEATRLSSTNVRPGTVRYMAPEQLFGDPEKIGPKCDIYALGCVLVNLLKRGTPTATPGPTAPADPDEDTPILDSSSPAPLEVDPALRAITLRACAREPEDRYAGMAEFAADLDAYLEGRPGAAPSGPPRRRKVTTMPTTLPLVRRDAIRFVFVGPGSSAPKGGPAPGRLFLDVGNDLRPGVLDHHHLEAYEGSTTQLVSSNPELVLGAVQPQLDPTAPFTIVLHESPDFDSVASAYLAVTVLTTGEFPLGTEALARYADKIDEGSIGHSLSNPFAPYAAYMQLLNRHGRLGRPADHAYWRECVQQGLDLVAFILERSRHDGRALPSIDAFACPGLFDEQDRQDVLADVNRYRRKLADPSSHAHQARLSFPGQFGGRVELDALLVRDVQNLDDPERCMFFKDWARSDRERSPGGEGFLGLSVFISESPRDPRRCILSVSPDSGASLRGLAALLDRAESDRRRQVYGDDDRVTDPATGVPKPLRAGYDNADPWYDGRAHGFTIVDSPQSGTLLTAEEIEEIFVRFGGVS